MADILAEEEQDREGHRSHILVLAGFSFSGLLALVVLEAALPQGLHVAIYCLLLSFLFYMFALNLQGYKARRWQDQVATAAMDVASLALILSVLSILHYQSFNRCFAYTLSLLAFLIWGSDHLLRLKFQWRYLKVKKEVREMNDRQTKQEREDEKQRELTFFVCPKHGIRYPKGSTCPKCAAEKKKR